MSLRVEDEQLFFDVVMTSRTEFHVIYSSWFDWTRQKCDSVWERAREFIVDNEIPIKKELKKSRKNRNDRPEPKKVPNYESFTV